MATLPSFLFDTYKRYKEETNQVATWLVKTAQKHGHSFDGERKPQAQEPSGRLKGKERKLAREAQKAKGLPKTPTPIIRCAITTKDFTDLADWIANLQPAVTVPCFVVALLRSAIRLRKRCAGWFEGNVPKERTPENQSHSHFIDVLERVLKILEPNSISEKTFMGKSGNRKMDLDGKVEPDVNELMNIYDVLAIDDDVLEDSITTPSTTGVTQNTTSSRTTSPSPSKEIYEMEVTVEEAAFALFCFLETLHDLREFLKSLWARYKDRTLDLMTVSVTTNTAFNLVSRMEDFCITLSTLRDPDFAQIMMRTAALEQGIDAGRDLGDTVNHPVQDVLRWLYSPALNDIKAMAPIIRKGGLPNVEPEIRSQDSIAITDGSAVDAEFAFMQTAAQFIYMDILGGGPITDELMRGLTSVFKGESISFWLNFATRIFMDIHEILGEDVSRGYSELRASGAYIASVLKKYLNLTESGIFAESKEDRKCFSRLNDLIYRWILSDPLDEFKCRVFNLPEPARRPFTLYQLHPLYCGLFQFDLYLRLRYYSTNLVTRWGSIVSADYIYEACRQLGHLRQIWPDMELVKEIHSPEKIFFGRVPQTLEEFYKCMQLTHGVSAVKFARHFRHDHSDRLPMKNVRRLLRPNAPVTNTLIEQFIRAGEHTLTISTVEHLLNQKPESNSDVSAEEQEDQSLFQRQWTKNHKMTPLQLLDTLCKAIAAEEHMIQFDYISLHFRCLRLFVNLKSILYIPREECSCGGHLARTVSDIFFHAIEYNVSVMGEANEIIERLIEGEGSVGRDRLERICVCWPGHVLHSVIEVAK